MNPDENKVVGDVSQEPVLEKDELTIALEKLAKAEEERDNYKTVALKRLGKLPGDAEFLNKDGSGELSVAEQIRLELLNREVEKAQEETKKANEKLIKENAELRLAIKNRPGSSIGGDTGSTSVVKDNVFTEQQLAALRAKALRLKADPEAFIQKAKENLLKR